MPRSYSETFVKPDDGYRYFEADGLIKRLELATNKLEFLGNAGWTETDPSTAGVSEGVTGKNFAPASNPTVGKTEAGPAINAFSKLFANNKKIFVPTPDGYKIGDIAGNDCALSDEIEHAGTWTPAGNVKDKGFADFGDGFYMGCQMAGGGVEAYIADLTGDSVQVGDAVDHYVAGSSYNVISAIGIKAGFGLIVGEKNGDLIAGVVTHASTTLSWVGGTIMSNTLAISDAPSSQSDLFITKISDTKFRVFYHKGTWHYRTIVLDVNTTTGVVTKDSDDAVSFIHHDDKSPSGDEAAVVMVDHSDTEVLVIREMLSSSYAGIVSKRLKSDFSEISSAILSVTGAPDSLEISSPFPDGTFIMQCRANASLNKVLLNSTPITEWPSSTGVVPPSASNDIYVPFDWPTGVPMAVERAVLPHGGSVIHF